MSLDTFLSLTSLFLMMFAFAGVCWWAFAPRRKKRFEDAANLPFADEDTEKSASDEQNK